MLSLVAFILAFGAAYGESPHRASSRDVSLKALTGIAQNGKMFAEVKTKKGPLPVSGVEYWPEGVEGQQVKVTGQFQTLAATPMDPNLPSQGYAHEIQIFVVKNYKVISTPKRK